MALIRCNKSSAAGGYEYTVCGYVESNTPHLVAANFDTFAMSRVAGVSQQTTVSMTFDSMTIARNNSGNLTITSPVALHVIGGKVGGTELIEIDVPANVATDTGINFGGSAECLAQMKKI